MKKINKKKIFSIFSIILVSFCIFSLVSSSVFAEINPDSDKLANDVAEGFNTIINKIGDIASNGFFAGFTGILTVLAGVVYLLIGLLFSGNTGSIFPTPDNIIFNRVAILDINFFNPNDYSIFGQALSGKFGSGNVVAQLYNTFQTIAISVFIIAAMIVGIKLALSSVAQEKAQCKKAITSWLVGIIVLFLMRLLLAAMFELNEVIVYELSKLPKEMSFTVNAIERIPVVGTLISDIVGHISEVFNSGNDGKLGDITLKGFNGFLAITAFKAFTGDLMSAVLLFVLIGQTVTLLVSYAKRLMYAMILGVMAPLIVAVDTIGKATKGQSTVLANWFKEMVLVVFNQTFHAILMVITLAILASLSKGAAAMTGIVSIILISGIIKFEKLYKQMFGIQDSLMGNLQGNAGKLMAGLSGAAHAGKALADNSKKATEARKNITAAKERKNKLLADKEGILDRYGKSTMNTVYNTCNAAQATTKPDEQRGYYEHASKAIDELEKAGFEDPALSKMKDFVNRQLYGNSESRRTTGSGSGTSPIRFNGENSGYSAAMGPGAGSGGGNSQVEFNGAGMGDIIDASIMNDNGSNRNHNSSSSNPSTPVAAASTGNAQSGTNNVGPSEFTGNTDPDVADNSEKESIKEELREIANAMKEANYERNQREYDRSMKSKDDEIKKADGEIEKAQRQYKSARFAQAMGPVNLAAGVGFGIGSGQEMSDSLFKGGHLTAGLDALSEKVGQHVGANVSSAISRSTSGVIGVTSRNVRKAVKNADRNFDVGNAF